MTGKILLLGGVIALPIAGYSYYKYAQANLTVDVGNASIDSFSDTTINATLDLVISSKAGIKFSITELTFNIYVNGTVVGSVRQSQVFEVPGNGSITVPVKAVIDLSIITTSIFDFIKAATGTGLVAQIDGTATAKVNLPMLNLLNINVPISEQLKLSV